MNYQMPVKAIKSILLKEHESFIQSIWKSIILHDYNRYIVNLSNTVIEKKINACESYDDLEEFINESRRMSLSEWIESL